MNFGRLRQQQSNDEISNLKRDIFTDLLFDALVLMLILHFGRKVDCGIPIVRWCVVYFLLLGLRSMANFAKILVVRRYYRYSNLYSIMSFIAIDGGFLLWLLYGNLLFYSEKNVCGDFEESRVLYNLMLVLLIIGYFQMLLYGLLLCCLPFILYVLFVQNRR